MNVPYVKQYDSLGQLINPIRVTKPYINYANNRRHRRAVGKYVCSYNLVTGELEGQVKSGGNNRKRNKRTGKMRTAKF